MKDDYAERLLELVHRKQRTGKDVVESAEAAEVEDADDVPEADLLETIRHSLQATNGRASRNGRHRKATRKLRPRQEMTRRPSAGGTFPQKTQSAVTYGPCTVKFVCKCSAVRKKTPTLWATGGVTTSLSAY